MIDKIKEEIFLSRYDFNGSVEDVIKELNNTIIGFKAKYPTCKELKFDLTTESGYDNEIEINLSIYGYRDKTSKDIKKEIDNKRHETNIRKKRYLILKKEFGGD